MIKVEIFSFLTFITRVKKYEKNWIEQEKQILNTKESANMKIISINKVPYKTGHNAFTGFGKYKDKYYLAFRHAASHVSDSYQKVYLVVLESDDLVNWRENLIHTETPANCWYYDYRDSFMNITNDRLALFSIVTLVNGNERVTHSEQRFLNPDTGCFELSKDFSFPTDCIWHPVSHEGKYYSTAYQKNAEGIFEISFLESQNGSDWNIFGDPLDASESSLQGLPNGDMLCFARQEKTPYYLSVYLRDHNSCKWQTLCKIPTIIQCPVSFMYHDKVYLLGRERPDYLETADTENPSFKDHRLKLYQFTNSNQLETILEFPSMGDCGYPGVIIEPDGSILISYYSQHEAVKDKDTSQWNEKSWMTTPTSLFIAKIMI
jgi:hypothetical protein